jgi:hypothetical protein
MVDYYRRLLSCRFVYCKRAFPTPQSQDRCYYRIPDSLHSRYRRLGYLEVTLLCWPIAVAPVFPRLRPELQELLTLSTSLMVFLPREHSYVCERSDLSRG